MNKNNTKNEKMTIGLLSATAALLLAACFFIPKPVTAQEAMKEGDFLLAVYPTATGNDALYFADTRADRMVVFLYNPAAKALEPAAVRPVSDAFRGR